jgi:hypothetical protein
MAKFEIETVDSWTVTKGWRNSDETVDATIDVTKLNAHIIAKLAMHGLQQKIADSAAGAKDVAEAEASMAKAIDALLAGEWSSRGSGEGVSEETRVARSVVRQAVKAKFGAKSESWAKFTGLSDSEQAAKLDEWFAANVDAFAPAVEKEMERRKAAAKAKAKLADALSIEL